MKASFSLCRPRPRWKPARAREFFLVNGEHAAKAADLTHHATGEGAVGKVLDALFGAIGAVNVNTAIGVGKEVFFNTSPLS